MVPGRSSGFTLIELLTVVAIIAVMSAVLYPVLSQAKVHAKDAVTISNLRQCGQALLIYEADSGDLPVAAAAARVLEPMPTCDHRDRWRSNCQGLAAPPMVGSFGYLGMLERYSGPEAVRLAGLESGSALVISPFHGSFPLRRIVGEGPPDPLLGCGLDNSCVMPETAPVFYLDGSARTVHRRTFDGHPGVYKVFSWIHMFPLYSDRGVTE